MGRLDRAKHAVRLEYLKRRAGYHYRQYNHLLDNMSCGAALGEYVSGEVANHKVKFNELMAEINTLDPSSPRVKLS